MPIAYVQSTASDLGTVTSGTLAFPSNVTSASLLVVVSRVGAQGRTVTVTDNNLNPTYTQILNQTDSGAGDELFFHSVPNVNSGATTVAIVVSGAASILRWAIHEYSGIATISPLDKSTSATGNSANANSGSVAITVANELIFGGTENGDASTSISVGAGYTQRENLVVSSQAKIQTEDKIVSSTGTYSVTATLSSPSRWACGIATFQALAAGGTGVISTGGATLNTGLRIPILARFP